MSGLEEGELEEGEITDSDSMGEEQKPPETQKPAAPHYSMFSKPATATSAPRSLPRPLGSESDDSDGQEDSDEDDDGGTKKRKFPPGKMGSHQSGPFVNPNFVGNGGRMPSMPKQSNRALWGSILQEQILTAEVGSFSMEKKLPSDRDVESYDYSRAKDDDRPLLVEDDVKHPEEDLFGGEVVDLEKATFNQRRNMKRKHVAERLGQRHSGKERLHVPKVTENSSVEEVTHFISKQLQEGKVHLIRRVVKVTGRAKALDLLKETEKVEAEGGMMIVNGARRRTPGGVFLTLLKANKGISKEQLEEIFEEENQWMEDMKKRRKARARSRKRHQEREGPRKSPAPSTAAEDKGNKTSSMEVMEDNSSHSSVKGETGSPKNHDDHLSDTQEGLGLEGKDAAKSDTEEEEEEEEEAKSEVGNFDSQLAHEVKRLAEVKEVKDPSAGGNADAITLDDVLEIDEDEDFLD